MAPTRAQTLSPTLRHRAREVPDHVDADAVLQGLSLATNSSQAVRQQVYERQSSILAPTGRFLAASTLWATATFLLCYIALPIGYSAAGLRPFTLLWTLPGSVLAFGFTWLLTAAAMLTAASRDGGLRVDLHGLGGSDRIPAAMLGGLMVWGLLHNLLPGLMPFGAMSLSFLGVFLVSNIIENVLFGTILATLTKTRRSAFLAGAAFQAMIGMSAWIL